MKFLPGENVRIACLKEGETHFIEKEKFVQYKAGGSFEVCAQEYGEIYGTYEERRYFVTLREDGVTVRRTL